MEHGSDSVGISNNEAKHTEATSSPQSESEKRAGETERGGEATCWPARRLHELRFSTHVTPQKPTFLIPI